MFVCNHCQQIIKSDDPKYFCSAKCESLWKFNDNKTMLKPVYQRQCKECRTIYRFSSKSDARYCKPCAFMFYALDRTMYATRTEILTGYYVYEWLDGDSVFYVGKGSTNRAWGGHSPLKCEEVRQSAKDFKVRIIMDNLEESDAFFLESVIISLRRHEGHPLTNVTGGLCAKHHDNYNFNSDG